MTTKHACIRCGACCREELCDLALTMLEQVQGPPCPALEFDGRQHSCGLVLHPQRYINLGPIREWKDEHFGRYFEQLLGMGKGCDRKMANW